MDRFGANVKTRIDEGQGICREIYSTYHCGCEYSSGCLDMGEGFEFFCDQHESEADRISLEMDNLLLNRDTAQGDELNVVKQKIYDLSVVRRTFYNQIMGR